MMLAARKAAIANGSPISGTRAITDVHSPVRCHVEAFSQITIMHRADRIKRTLPTMGRRWAICWSRDFDSPRCCILLILIEYVPEPRPESVQGTRWFRWLRFEVEDAHGQSEVL